ncbi:Calx-beta domain protein [Gimesia chilikensis]|uniref:Calx-beta domain protein n=1 Tax=Gimesia chilikensis TaxID=2605989 RepID=A0A517PXR5_9PLAN|nr:Calx-beta domain protein [Gimesia chilikensis]
MSPSLWLPRLKRQFRIRQNRKSRLRGKRNQRYGSPAAPPAISTVAETLEDRTLLTSLISIDDVTAGENETFMFQISLDQAAADDVTVRVNTQTDTASDNDFTFLSNKLVTIPAGELSTQVTVHVHDDEVQELDETFSLVLSDVRLGGETLPADLDIADGTGQGTILNDDGLPGSVFTITGEKIVEGDSDGQLLKFTITRTGGSIGDLNFDTSVEFTTINGTAVAGEDYTTHTETVHFSAHSYYTSQTSYVYVSMQGDLFQELSETVIGRISNPTGGSVLKGNVASLDVTGIITNDDSDFNFQDSYSADPAHANHTYDQFGSSVAIDGDIMVVGAPQNDDSIGVAYVYARNQQGTPLDQSDDTWDYQTYLRPSRPYDISRTRYGYYLAISDDTIVFSALANSSYILYVFTRVGDDWVSEAPREEVITLDGTFYNRSYFNPVDIYGNTIVIGGLRDASSGVEVGSTYVLEKTGADWSAPLVRKLTQPVFDETHLFGGAGTIYGFGGAVAIHGDIIVVGAQNEDGNESKSGAAYVYTKVGDSWVTNSPLVTRIIASDGMANDRFGFSVATNGKDVAVGASTYNSDGTVRGRAYLYTKNGEDWISETPTEIKFSSENKNFKFGYSVALNDRHLVLGEPYGANAGLAYVYTKEGVDWDRSTVSETILTYPGDESYAYAVSVAISDDSVVIGSPFESLDGWLSGGIFTFGVSENSSWTFTDKISPTEIATSHNGSDDFGDSIAVSENYLVISAPGTDSTLAPTGVVYIYVKNDAGTRDFKGDDFWAYETTLFDPAPEQDRYFGMSVAIDGDTIVVSSETAYTESEVYIFTRNGQDWVTTTPTVTPLLAQFHRSLRREINVAIQNDTIIVGSPYIIGQVLVYQKNGSDWSTVTPTQTVLTASDGTRGDNFGTAVDIDGDKIIVGADENENRGAAYIYQKGASGWDSATETKLTGSDLQDGDYFGSSVAIEGDVAVVGSPYGGKQDLGAVYIYNGKNSWSNPLETKLNPVESILPYTGRFGKYIDIDGQTLVIGTTASLPGQFDFVYVYESGDGWDSFRETVISKEIETSSTSVKIGGSFGRSLLAFQNDNLFIASQDWLYDFTSSTVYSLSKRTASFEQRIVTSRTNTQLNGEVSSLPENQNTVNEWSTYWAELWINASNLKEQGVFSAGLDLSYNSELTSATEIEFGPGFSQSQAGLINDASGTIEGLYAETTASDLGTDSYVLFARIKFGSLADDQVALDFSGKSIGPHDLGLNISSQQIKLVGDTPISTSVEQMGGTSIFANPYDLNDDGAINFSDLLRFATVYQQKPSESSSDYAWFADYNQDDRVNFQDLILFAANYGKRKSGDTPVTYPQNYPDAWNQLLTVAPAPPPSQSATTIQQSTAESLLDSTVAEITPQLPPAQQQTLSEIDIKVVDLANESLGRAAAGTIYIDVNAAGYGWFIDTTPAEHSEFSPASDLTLIALPDSEAAGLIDLRTIILHEIGHLLGYEHGTAGLMQETLAPGVRYLADWESATDEFFGSLTDETALSIF